MAVLVLFDQGQALNLPEISLLSGISGLNSSKNFQANNIYLFKLNNFQRLEKAYGFSRSM
ncbi:hypothetical protein N836_05900 [Leptolyngbya sp. Heron Island J]|nr:hypothetical protein N836_05900 [Leptolyngbya sp. Heron Island J]